MMISYQLNNNLKFLQICFINKSRNIYHKLRKCFILIWMMTNRRWEGFWKDWLTFSINFSKTSLNFILTLEKNVSRLISIHYIDPKSRHETSHLFNQTRQLKNHALTWDLDFMDMVANLKTKVCQLDVNHVVLPYS